MATPPQGELPIKYSSVDTKGNTDLQNVEFLFQDQLTGVETVAVDSNGQLGLVDKYGKVYLATPSGDSYQLTPDPITHIIPGRSLGAMFDAEGNLYVCNSPLGLMKVVSPGDPDKQKLIMATSRVTDDSALWPGTPVEFIDGIDIASDGTVYLTQASDVIAYRTEDDSWDAVDSVYVTLQKGAPVGMLMAYYPSNDSTHALMDKMWFANGVVLAHDESYVLVGDSLMAKIHRYWLKGPKAGTHEVFLDNLPGPPDGLARSSDGNFWVAIPSVFPPLVKISQFRLVRVLIGWLPRIMRLLSIKPPGLGLVLKVSPEGQIVQTLADPKGSKVFFISSAVEHAGKLFLGTLGMPGVPVLKL